MLYTKKAYIIKKENEAEAKEDAREHVEEHVRAAFKRVKRQENPDPPAGDNPGGNPAGGNPGAAAGGPAAAAGGAPPPQNPGPAFVVPVTVRQSLQSVIFELKAPGSHVAIRRKAGAFVVFLMGEYVRKINDVRSGS